MRQIQILTTALLVLCSASAASAKPTQLTGEEANVASQNAFQQFSKQFMPGTEGGRALRRIWNSREWSVGVRHNTSVTGPLTEGFTLKRMDRYHGEEQKLWNSWNWQSGAGKVRVRSFDMLGDYKPGKYVPNEIASARSDGKLQMLRTVTRSDDGKIITGKQVTYQRLKANAANVRKDLPASTARPRLIARISRLINPEGYAEKRSGFLGLPNRVVSGLRGGSTFALVKERTRVVEQPQPSLPRQNRPPAKYTRSTSYKLYLGDKGYTIGKQAFTALRGRYGTAKAMARSAR